MRVSAHYSTVGMYVETCGGKIRLFRPQAQIKSQYETKSPEI